MYVKIRVGILDLDCDRTKFSLRYLDILYRVLDQTPPTSQVF